MSEITPTNAPEVFIEPRVHPDIDKYFQEKLKEPIKEKERLDKRRAEGKAINRNIKLNFPEEWGDRWLVDDMTLEQLSKEGNIEEVKKIEQVRKEFALINGSPEQQIKRLQQAWSAAARGDFTLVSEEINRDIAYATNTLNDWKNPRSSDAQKDNLKYYTTVAEINEWQTALQENPIDPNTRLGKQVNKTVVDLIQRRDGTYIGHWTKQVKTLERVQKTVATLQPKVQK